MALSPYRECDSSVYRSRSSSFTSPTSRNFLYQEVLEIGGNALVRSFSCGQVFAKDKSGQTIQTTQFQISNFMSPTKNFSLNVGNNPKSWSVPKKMHIKYHEKPVKSKMSLKFTVSEEGNKADIDYGDKMLSTQRLSPIWTNMKRTLYLNLFILTLLSAIYIYRFKHCNKLWDTQVIINKLDKSVYGQEVAISKVENVLMKFSKSQVNAVMCFTGSVGVGKTFVSSIIYENFPWESNEYINFFDLDTKEILQTKKYATCGVNLIVIDGIDVSIADVVIRSVEFLLETQKSAKFLVILIFRTRNKDEEDIVLKNMEKASGNFHYIPFKNLNQEEIEQCFNAELKRQKKFITQKKLKELLVQHMKFCNIAKSFLGCKNVFKEVSLLPKND